MQRGYRDELQGGVLQLALEAGRHVRRSEIYCLQNPHSPQQPTFLLDFYFAENKTLKIEIPAKHFAKASPSPTLPHSLLWKVGF